MNRLNRRWQVLFAALSWAAGSGAVLTCTPEAVQAGAPVAVSPNRAAEPAAARALAARGDALLASASEAEALAHYHEALRALGARLPAFTRTSSATTSDYASIRTDELTDTLLAGDVLGRLAQTYLHVFFQGPGRLSGDAAQLQARRADPIAERHGLGMAAADASVRILEEAYREFVTQGGGPLSMHERRWVWRLLRRAHDLKMDDRADFYRVLGGDGRMALLALSEALQYRAPTLLEALWLRRAGLQRMLPDQELRRVPPRLLLAYANVSEVGLLFGYARDAVLAERAEQRPRDELIKSLEQDLRALKPDVQAAADAMLAAIDSAGPDVQKNFNTLWWYPRHWMAGGFLVESGLGPDDALIQFYETPRHLFAFVFDPSATEAARAVMLLTVSSDPPAIASEVTRMGRLLRQNAPGWQSAASGLYLKLMAPLAPYLGNRKRLFVVPSGSLNTLSFQALMDPRVAAPPPVVLLPHAELLGPRLKALPLGSGKPSALVVGIDRFAAMPQLERAESEAGFVAGILGAGSTLLLGSRSEAGKARILGALSDRALIHIASHARFDRRAMQSSMTVQGEGDADAAITGFDLLRRGVRLDGALVVLSACDTGELAVDEGEDPLGLGSVLLIAGAQAVVVSQWRVADRATEWIMRRFYQGLKAGQTAEAALAEATRALRKELPEFNHPHFWAAFVVIGDGRWQLPEAMR